MVSHRTEFSSRPRTSVGKNYLDATTTTVWDVSRNRVGKSFCLSRGPFVVREWNRQLEQSFWHAQFPTDSYVLRAFNESAHLKQESLLASPKPKLRLATCPLTVVSIVAPAPEPSATTLILASALELPPWNLQNFISSNSRRATSCSQHRWQI